MAPAPLTWAIFFSIVNCHTKMDHHSKESIMGPQDRRLRELEERKKLILEKSRELFFQKGFDAVTIQDICEAVEFGRSAIYALFESKEELYSHIYIDAIRIIIDLSARIDPEREDFDGEFLKIGEILFRFYDKYTDYFKVLSHFSTKGMVKSKIPARLLEEKERLYEESSRPFRQLLEKAMGRGLIREVDPEEFILLFYASVIGIISLYIFAEEEQDREIIHRAVMTHTVLYRDGLKQRGVMG